MPNPQDRVLVTEQDYRSYAFDIARWIESGAGWRDVAPHIEHWSEGWARLHAANAAKATQQRQWVVMFFNPTTGCHTADCVYESDTAEEAVAKMRRHICSTYSESFVMSVEQFKAACCEVRK